MESIEEKKITIENNSNESFSFKNETKITEKTEINNYENEWEKIELNIKKTIIEIYLIKVNKTL
jgi:hypothetical protein